MKMNIINDLKEGKINKVIAGGGNGSIVLIDIIKGDDKFVLYLYCTWRMSFYDNVLTGWNDSDTVIVTELKKLQNDIIEEVISNLLGDFTLIFKSGIKLDVFCDITSNIENTSIEENWSLCDVSKNKCYNFTNKFSFFSEHYEK